MHQPIFIHKSNYGATLIEMLLVVAIVALVAAIVIPSLSLPARPPLPPIAQFLEQQRLAAVADGKTRRIFWAPPKLISEPDRQTFDMPKDSAIVVERPDRTGYLDKQLLAVFYADGTAIASQFSVTQKKLASPSVLLYKVSISPFHSEISFFYP